MKTIHRTLLGLFVLCLAVTGYGQITVMQPLTTFGTNGDGSVRPNDVLGLTSTSQFQRGMAYNPTTGHVLYVDRSTNSSAANDVHIIDGNTGAYIGKLDNSSTLAGGNAAFTLNMIGVADDGAIYVANLTSGTSTAPQTRLYRWENEAALETLVYPTPSFPTDDPTAGNTNTVERRIGDTMSVRGSGLTTQILLANRGTLTFLFTPDDNTYAHFTPTILTNNTPAGSLGWGLTFGAGNTFWGTAGAQTDGPLYRMQYNTGAGTATALNTNTTPGFPGTITPILAMPSSNLLAGITMVSGADVVRLYDVSNPATPVLQDRKSFATTTQNNIFGGALALGTNGVLYALDSDNGIMAFTLIPTNSNPLPPAFFRQPATTTAVAGNSATFISAADSTLPVQYQWYYNGSNVVAGATTATLTLNNVQLTNSGNYSVIASNSSGTVTSSVAGLTVSLSTGGSRIVNEPFPYNSGQNLVGTGKWFATAGQDATFKTDSGNLNVSGLAASSGNRIFWPKTPASSARITNGVPTSSGSLYFSFAYRVDDLSTLTAGGAGSTMAAFCSDFTTATYATKIDVRKDIGGVGYNLGVFKGTGENNGAFSANVLSLSNTVFVVGRYVYGDNAADDTEAMWINPDPSTFGLSNAPPPTVGDIGIGTTDFGTIVGFAFRTSGGPAVSFADELRVGLTWADVTPPFRPPPTLTITPSGSSSVNVSWPLRDSDYTLVTSSDINASLSTWTAVTNSPIVVGTNIVINLSNGNTQSYFSLKK